MSGRNLFQGHLVSKSVSYSESTYTSKPCVFVSYKGDDKRAAQKIVALLKAADVDVYFDEDDYMLTVAAAQGDDTAVVKFIEDGIKVSTHILAVISNKTKESWWVSFEIGSGRRKGCHIAYVALEDVTSLPSYLKIATKITADASLATWIKANFVNYITKSYTFNEVSVPKLPRYDRTIGFYNQE